MLEVDHKYKSDSNIGFTWHKSQHQRSSSSVNFAVDVLSLLTKTESIRPSLHSVPPRPTNVHCFSVKDTSLQVLFPFVLHEPVNIRDPDEIIAPSFWGRKIASSRSPLNTKIQSPGCVAIGARPRFLFELNIRVRPCVSSTAVNKISLHRQGFIDAFPEKRLTIYSLNETVP